jgi:hypothetical protein
MRIPDTIHVVISAGKQPVPGMLAMLKFVTSQKNSFNFVFGPSDAAGNIQLSREQLIAEAQKDREFFLMDYAEIEFAWTGTLIVTPMNRDAIKRARSAFELFRLYPFRGDYKESLDAADAALSQIPNAELIAHAQCSTTENTHIEVVTVTAA